MTPTTHGEGLTLRAWVALVAPDQEATTPEHYDALTRLWREVVGPVHPDDGPLP